MKEFLTELFARYENEFSGACAVSMAEAEVFAHAAGFAGMAFGARNTVDTKFACASVTKVFTAAAVLLLVQEGCMCMDNKITDIIDLSGTKIPRDVTLFHLLTHTSGIADDADEEAGEDFAALFIERPSYSLRECADYLPMFAYREPNFAAGTGVRYNNCGFILLGLAIEAVTGIRCRDFIEERVFHACGMENSRFCAMDEINPDTAEGYIAVRDETGAVAGWKRNIFMTPPIGYADGGSYTTVRDMDRFLRAVKSESLLSPELSAGLLRPHCPHSRQYGPFTWRAGYAFEFLERGDRIFCMYKEGMDSGAEAMLSYYPELDLTVNLLSNKNGCVFRLHHEIAEHIMTLL